MSTKGFTLAELLISIAIISVVSSIVLVKYSNFDSTVLLKSSAYEIALNLRDAQVRSVSVSRGNSAFDYPYGVTFSKGQSYTLFQFASTSSSPWYDVSEPDPNAVPLTTFTFPGAIRIRQINVYGDTDMIDVDRLDVSFQRPEFSALFYAIKGGDVETDITSVEIFVDSPNGDSVFKVTISRLGQIYVSFQE